MRTTMTILSVLTVFQSICLGIPSSQTEVQETVLDFYRCFGPDTDPDEHDKLYQDLPESLEELCRLIQCQLIHPFQAQPYAHVLTPDRRFDEQKYTTVNAMLAGFVSYDPNGLVFTRKPQHRLVLSCRFYSILLASILKHRDIPTRCRYGFGRYISTDKDMRVCHVICEVWNKEQQRWMLVDPILGMIDFPAHQFEYATQSWQRLRQGKVNPEKYGVAGMTGNYHILDMLCHDMAAVLGEELLYKERPPISQDEGLDATKIERNKLDILDELADLLEDPDHNLKALRTLMNKHACLQVQRN
ncbi:MAG: transglutaminase [Planctomycetota bacterium]